MVTGQFEIQAASSTSTDLRTTRAARVAEWLLILLAPAAAWLFFGIVLINQDGHVDPWLYLGYGRAFSILQATFGWTYYAVRFPVMMLNGWFVGADHPLLGYAALRYLLLLTCGIPLYFWARRAFGQIAAVVGYLFLVCNPLLSRILLWDLTTFVSVPMALAGMAVWLWSDRVGSRFVSGVLMMGAIASHAFTGTAIATFLFVQAVRRIRSSEWRGLLRDDVLATAIGAAVCYGIGCLYYYSQLGLYDFDPRVIVTVTVTAAGAGEGYAADHQTPFHVWAVRESHVYIPPLCVAIAAALLGRRILENSAIASAWWFGFLYTAAYYAYQLVFGRFVLETVYYFAHLTLVVYLLVPVIVGELARARPQRVAGLLGSAVAALVALPLVHHFLPGFGSWFQATTYDNWTVLMTVGLLAGLLAASTPLLVRRGAAVVVLVTFVLLVQTLAFMNPAHRVVFESQHRSHQAGVYMAAVQMMDVFAANLTPETPVLLWYCGTQKSLRSVASTASLHTVNHPWMPKPCQQGLGTYELERLSSIQPRYVLMLSEDAGTFVPQVAALRDSGYVVQDVLARTIGDAAYRADLRLVQITRATP